MDLDAQRKQKLLSVRVATMDADLEFKLEVSPNPCLNFSFGLRYSPKLSLNDRNFCILLYNICSTKTQT